MIVKISGSIESKTIANYHSSILSFRYSCPNSSSPSTQILNSVFALYTLYLLLSRRSGAGFIISAKRRRIHNLGVAKPEHSHLISQILFVSLS